MKKWKNKLAQRAKRLKTDIPAVFLAIRNPRTPWYAKALACLTVAYALSPIDLIPDFIPVLGFLDDVLLLPMLVAATVRLIPADVFAQCQKRADGLWQDGKPKKWYYALPIILFWLLLLALLARAIWR